MKTQTFFPSGSPAWHPTLETALVLPHFIHRYPFLSSSLMAFDLFLFEWFLFELFLSLFSSSQSSVIIN